MLFETLKQSYIFLGCLYFGLIAGILKEVSVFVINLFKKNKIITFIIDLIYMLVFSLLFILCINIVNYGEFRVYLLLGYILGYILERKSLGFLVDFIIKKIYTFIKFIYNKLIKIKFIKRIIGSDSTTSKKVNKNR